MHSISNRERIISTVAGGLNVALRRVGGRQQPTQPARVLLTKPCCIGDVLFATPLLAVISDYWPQARIGWLVGQHSRVALLGNPRIHALLDSAALGAGHYPFRAMLTIAYRLRRKRFAAAFVPDRSPALALLMLMAGIPYRVGLNSQGRGIGLSAPAPIDDRKAARHEVDIYLDLARVAGLPIPAQPHMEYHTSGETVQAASQLLASLALDTALPIVTIHPGGGVNPGANMPSKRWPVARFAAIAERLSERANVLVLGDKGEDDRQLASTVAADNPRIHNIAGQLALPATAAMLQRAKLHLGNDTGLSHLAVACGCRTIAIFGPTSVLRYGLYGPPSQVCSVHPPNHPDGGGDTADVSLDAVNQAVHELTNAEW